jgi:curved DNA-binding protein
MASSGGLDEILRGQGRRQTARTPQYQTEMVISLQEAYHGSTRKVGIGDRHFDVKVPKGAKSGTKLRLKGAGPAGPNGQPADVYLVIKVSPDPRFERKGEDLYTEVFVDIPTAVLGGKVKVPAPTGSVSLKIPAGTQSGQTFRLRGKGMPKLKSSSQHGDLFASVDVIIPKQLSTRQRELFEQLSKEQ